MLSLDRFLALDIASSADVEFLDTYANNIDHYEREAYTYIPIPASNKFYHVDDGKLRDINDEQYLHPDLPMLTALERLQDYPFLLYNQFMKFEEADEGTIGGYLPVGEPEFEIKDKSLTPSQIRKAPEEFLNELSEDDERARNVIKLVMEQQNPYYILTVADTNKRQARELFYHVLSEFEIQLANSIEKKYPNSLIEEVSEEEIERWYRAKLDKLEIHIAEHMYLSTLLKVAGKDEKIRREFGCTSHNQFDNKFGGLNNLRHKVMHPTRALAHNSKDLEKQVARIKRALSTLENTELKQIEPHNLETI